MDADDTTMDTDNNHADSQMLDNDAEGACAGDVHSAQKPVAAPAVAAAAAAKTAPGDVAPSPALAAGGDPKLRMQGECNA